MILWKKETNLLITPREYVSWLVYVLFSYAYSDGNEE